MGNALHEKGDLDEALDSFQQALKHRPEYAEAYNNMGNIQKQNREPILALKSYRMAVKIKPNYANAYNNIGAVLQGKGVFDEAIQNYQTALDIRSEASEAYAQKLHLQAHICDWESLAKEKQAISLLGIEGEEISPFAMLSLEDAPERHRSRAENYAKAKFPPPRSLFLKRPPSHKPEKLRVAYFSADFHAHPVMHLIAHMFELHDKTQFEVYAYSFGPDKKDHMRKRIIKAVDKFTDLENVTDLDAVTRIRKEQIDIAIDLTGYTRNFRTGIFAQRIAPIQINYLGYPSTMGADFMDYIISDKVLVPDQNKYQLSEKVIEMPNSYMVTDATRGMSQKFIKRAQVGLPEESFVFCGFNNSYKISPNEFDIWARLLHAVKGSVLWLRHSNKWAEKKLRDEIEKRGIEASRLIFSTQVPLDEHITRHKLADLFLDTFTYNAHSTAVDALWAGLPIVTKLGNGFAARVAGSLLTAVGMPELITSTDQEYENLALSLATQPHQLAHIRRKLKKNRLSTPLFNSNQFTQHLENGYQQAYTQFFEGKKPEHIYVCD